MQSRREFLSGFSLSVFTIFAVTLTGFPLNVSANTGLAWDRRYRRYDSDDLERVIEGLDIILSQDDFTPERNLTVRADIIRINQEVKTFGRSLRILARQLIANDGAYINATGLKATPDFRPDDDAGTEDKSAGSHGKRGANGGKGGSGGHVRIFVGDLQGHLIINTSGADGGAAQSGGTGRKGRTGGVGKRPGDKGGTGYMGGEAGEAGVPGDGGDAGTVTVEVVAPVDSDNLTIIANGGLPGTPAKHGKPGEPGDPGPGGAGKVLRPYRCIPSDPKFR